MKTRNVISGLFNAAVRTRPVQFFIRHAGKIGGAAFALGDGVLIGKDYILTGHIPNGMEQAAGFIFLGTDVGLALIDRYPHMKAPTGLGIVFGAAALGYSGVGSAGQNWQIFSCALIAIQGVAFMFEKQIHGFAGRMEKGKSRILRAIFRPLAKYPIATMSTVDIIVSKSSMAYAAILKGDMGLLAGSLLWIVGGMGVIASDESVKALAVRPKTHGKIQPQEPGRFPQAKAQPQARPGT